MYIKGLSGTYTGVDMIVYLPRASYALFCMLSSRLLAPPIEAKK